MHKQNGSLGLRRSSRVAAVVPIMVTGPDGTQFSEVCETSVVNAHGCAMRSPIRFDPGASLHLHSREGRKITAQVVECLPIGPNGQGWSVGARLERPENFWGLQKYPKDWELPLTSTASRVSSPAAIQSSPQPVSKPEVNLMPVAPAFSESDARKIVAETIGSLQSDLNAIQEKLSRAEANRSRFDVSLSSIPAELEQQLEERLRQNLGPRLIDEVRQQSMRLLSATESTIGQRLADVRQEFQQRSTEELQAVEQRAAEMSAQIIAYIREQLRDGVADLERKSTDGRNGLKNFSEQLSESLQAKLLEQFNGGKAELETLRTAATAESSRLREQIEQLDARIRKLDGSVRSLESGYEERLTELANNVLNSAREEMERMAATLMKELTARGTEILQNQVDEAAGSMRILQKGAVASASDSLKTQAAEAAQAFRNSIEELARQSVDRWRNRLASGMNALIKNLGEQFQSEAASGND